MTRQCESEHVPHGVEQGCRVEAQVASLVTSQEEAHEGAGRAGYDALDLAVHPAEGARWNPAQRVVRADPSADDDQTRHGAEHRAAHRNDQCRRQQSSIFRDVLTLVVPAVDRVEDAPCLRFQRLPTWLGSRQQLRGDADLIADE